MTRCPGSSARPDPWKKKTLRCVPSSPSCASNCGRNKPRSAASNWHCANALNARRIERQTGAITGAVPTVGRRVRKLFPNAGRRVDNDEKRKRCPKARAGMVGSASHAAMLSLRQTLHQAGRTGLQPGVLGETRRAGQATVKNIITDTRAGTRTGCPGNDSLPWPKMRVCNRAAEHQPR